MLNPIHNPVHIVWFKRDLRVVDHAPLAAACSAGAVLPLFCWEPTVWAGEDYAKQHQQFVMECLAELEIALQKIGLQLLVSNVGIVETLNSIRLQAPIAGIYSHEETGNGASFAVDKAVAAWCKYHAVNWLEMPQNGVVRRLKNRNHWNSIWEQRMNAPQAIMPAKALAASVLTLPITQMIVAQGVDKHRRQNGGRSQA